MICAQFIILPFIKKKIMHQLFYKHLLKIFFCISIFCTASYVFHWQSWACLRQLQLQQLSENKAEWSPRDEFFFFKQSFCYCLLLCSSGQKHPIKANCVHRTMGELSKGSGSGSCSEGGNTWLMVGHQWCSSGFSFTANSLQCCCQQPGQRSWVHTE